MLKPRPIEFLVRGYEIEQCREILAGWDSLTNAEQTGIMSGRCPLKPLPALVAEKPTLRLVVDHRLLIASG